MLLSHSEHNSEPVALLHCEPPAHSGTHPKAVWLQRGLVDAHDPTAIDFRKLYARAGIHPGLILILPMVRPPRQQKLFRAALKAVEGRTDLINRVIEVDQAGDDIVLREFEIPSP